MSEFPPLGSSEPQEASEKCSGDREPVQQLLAALWSAPPTRCGHNPAAQRLEWPNVPGAGEPKTLPQPD